ncbi:hypothetical protein ACXWRS_10175, partial [Streptococcus pyogenes]
PNLRLLPFLLLLFFFPPLLLPPSLFFSLFPLSFFLSPSSSLFPLFSPSLPSFLSLSPPFFPLSSLLPLSSFPSSSSSSPPLPSFSFPLSFP